MAHLRRFVLLAWGAAALSASGLLFAIGAGPASAAGSVASVTGSAFGFGSFSIVGPFGALKNVGPTPAVTLASNASNSPQSGTAASGSIIAGPADLFSSGAITVQTAGSLGAAGSVSSSSDVKTLNTTGNEPLTAADAASSCKATTSGNTGSATITGGSVVTDDSTNPPTTATVPANPAPNTSIAGVVHVGAAVDHFHYVFNEQSTSGGVLTVNAVHEYLDGPLTSGSWIAGQAVCGVNSSSTAGSGSSGSSSSSSGVKSATVPATGSAGGTVLSSVLLIVGLGLISAAFLPRRRTQRQQRQGRGPS
ncbi:MAG TPA: hypothetical protein VF155_00505 [Candidatus Dormibacteraeota bacterium]